MKNFSWRDEFGIFFDSAERHDCQRSAGTRTGKTSGAENLLQHFDRGCIAVIYGYIRVGIPVARSR